MSRAVILVLLVGCGGTDAQRTSAGSSTTSPNAETTLSTAVATDLVPYLPPLEGYLVSDDVPVDELLSALEDPNVVVELVDVRLIIDDDGLQMGRVEAIVYPPDTPRQSYVEAVYGGAPVSRVVVQGQELARVEAANGILLWDRGSSVIVFHRAQEQTDSWLQELAAATIRAMT